MGEKRTPPKPIFFETPAELRDWLDRHHQTADELIVGAWKKATGKPSLTWEQIVDEALCVGWIDGVRRGVPGDGWSIRLTPRRKGSNWSRVNIDNVARLESEGRMRPAGRAAFELRTEARSGVYSYEQRHRATLTDDEERASNLFSTHPATLDRINRLRQLTGDQPLEGAEAAQLAGLD